MSIGQTIVDFGSLKRALKAGACYKASVNIRGFNYKLPIFQDTKTGILWTYRIRPKKRKSTDDKGKPIFINTDVDVIDVSEVLSINGAFYGKDPIALEIPEFDALTK